MMEKGEQLDLWKGMQLRDAGIQRAEDNANIKHSYLPSDWSEGAYRYLLTYCAIHRKFMAEDVRVSSADIIPEPPSLRAWGAVFVRAVKAGIIQRKGYQNVSNAKAHRTPATLWEVVSR